MPDKVKGNRKKQEGKCKREEEKARIKDKC
jgi:hypothetical protein